MEPGHPPLSVGFPRKEYWSGLSFPSPGDLPNLGLEPASPAWQADFFRSQNSVREVLLSRTSPWDDARPSRMVKTKSLDRGDGEFRQEVGLLGLGLNYSSPRSLEITLPLWTSVSLSVKRKGLDHRISKLSFPLD